MKRILINCSNLHGGGSAAVATSFISFLATSENAENFSLLLSSYVFSNLKSMRVDFSRFNKVEIFDAHGISAIFGRLSSILNLYDTVFTVFGPAYIFRMHGVKHIIGFAQPWIVYPNNLLSKSFSMIIKIKYNIKYLIQSLFFRRANILLVELNHVRLGLLANRLFKKNTIHIIHSEVDKIFFNKSRWINCVLPKKNVNHLNIGIISRNYPHKNLKILPAVYKILKEHYLLDVNFYVTFSDAEWNDCSAEFRSTIINCGILSLAQCPSFYEQLDGVIFPSYLECFSAVPIEAMVMKKPLFASNLPFIYDCCKSYCEYFDPANPNEIASSISHYFKDICVDQKLERLENAYSYVLEAFPSGLRAKNYLSIISE